MEWIKYFFILISICFMSCESSAFEECEEALYVPAEICESTDTKCRQQYLKAKWILYKMNTVLGSSIEAGMPGSISFAKTVESLITLDLIYVYHIKDGENTVYTFEFEGGVYPSEHPYYNTVKFYSSSGQIEISESERFSWLIDQNLYNEDFEQFVDSTKFEINTFIACYSPAQ